jgi:hypothetical protein
MEASVSFKLATKQKVLKGKGSLFSPEEPNEEEKFLQCQRMREEGNKLAEAGMFLGRHQTV